MKTSFANRATRASQAHKLTTLTDFALAVQREIVIRAGIHAPQTPDEKVWAKLGLCEPFELTTVQKEMAA